MLFYKKLETRFKHDTERQKHLTHLRQLRAVWNRTHDIKILKLVIRYENQLIKYDQVKGYNKLKDYETIWYDIF